MKAWRLSELGDPWDVLSVQEVDPPTPGAGEARVVVSASDLNFADILQCQQCSEQKDQSDRKMRQRQPARIGTPCRK